jgi:nucleoside-diphosphate-sugar epimerase
MKPTHFLVTGHRGFLGTAITEYLLGLGHRVSGLGRGAGGAAWAYELGQELTVPIWESLDQAVLVHAAYTTRESDVEVCWKKNFEGSRILFESARALGVRKIVFLSSTAAFNSTESEYGKIKLACEGLLTGMDVALRVGLVVGRGGLFGRIVDHMDRGLPVPLFYGGDQRVQVVGAVEVAKAVGLSVERSLSGPVYVCSQADYALAAVYAAAAQARSVPFRSLKLPGEWVLRALRFMEPLLGRAGVSLPIHSQNLVGLKMMRTFEVRSDLERLGLTIPDLEVLAQRDVGLRSALPNL